MFNITEQEGIRKSCLLWTKDPLDLDGRPVYITPFPRGVKEYSHDDLETLPGTSFISKKETVWPPPPVGKGTASSSEMCVSRLGVCLKVLHLPSPLSIILSTFECELISYLLRLCILAAL